MGLEETARLVARGYDLVADAYERLEGARAWPRLRWLGEVLEHLPPAARVLDLGCGSAIPGARELVDRGHSVIGLDVSGEQVTRARANVPEAEFIHASALEADFPPASFDAVVSLYLFDHLPRETHARLLASISAWLRNGGWLLATFESGDRPDTVDEWLGVPMFFSHFDAAHNEALVRGAGFEIVTAQEETQLEGDRDVPYLWVLARKAQP
jgi:SAM-dependent methyltransferase